MNSLSKFQQVGRPIESALAIQVADDGLPDFFIVGAGKSGTTALYEYLSAHPSVFMSTMKEPAYFCSDIKGTNGVRSLDEYRALFGGAKPEAMIGEASAMYLFSSVAIERIMSANPLAKVIVMLRKPEDAARALHQHCLILLREDLENFEDAWHAQPLRAKGLRLPANCPEPKVLQYGEVFSYASQIQRVLSFVPEGQRHFIIYEEFFSDPLTHYAEVLKFIGLPSDGRTEFPIVNGARKNRSKAFARLLNMAARDSFPFSIPRRLAHALGLHPLKALADMNSVPVEKVRLRPAFAAELREYFAPDVARLETLLGRRLKVWL